MRPIRYWWMRSSTSPQICSGEVRNRSSVWLTVPSVEFSTGTTPKSALPASTSWNTSSIDGSGSARTEWPKCLSTAAWREGALGPEVGDLQRLLLRQAGRHDLAEQPQDLLVAQRALCALGAAQRHAQHLRLALGPVEIDQVAVACAWRCRPGCASAGALVQQRRAAARRRRRCAARGLAEPGDAPAGFAAAGLRVRGAPCAVLACGQAAWPCGRRSELRADSTPSIARMLAEHRSASTAPSASISV